MKLFEFLAEKIRQSASKRGYTCDACKRELFTYYPQRLCLSCEGELCKNDDLVCPKCGRKTVADGVCLTCKSHMPKITNGASPCVYKDKAAALINRLKNGDRRLSFYFGERMAHYFLLRCETREEWGRYALNDKETLIVPMPISHKRKRERGYNQAEELAKAFQDVLAQKGVAVPLDCGVMQVHKETRAQKKLGLKQRYQNAQGAYRIKKRTLCKNKVILLIDDIMTTGATGSACAKLLLGAGAKAVLFLTATSLGEEKTD